MVTLRPLDAKDEPLVRQMLYHAIHVPAGEYPPPPEIVDQPALRRYYEDWGREGDAGYAAEADGTVLGVAWIRLLGAERRGYGWVADHVPELSIAVLPHYRGQGIGTRLLGRLLAARPPSGQPVSLSVSRHNPAVRLYRRFGFETVADDGTTLTMVFPATTLSA